MPRPFRSKFLLVIGAVALALSLSACGRKGPLDPPPGGYAISTDTVRTPISRQGKQVESPNQKPEYDEEGRPIAPQGQNRRIWPDVLLD